MNPDPKNYPPYITMSDNQLCCAIPVCQSINMKVIGKIIKAIRPPQYSDALMMMERFKTKDMTAVTAYIIHLPKQRI